MQRRKCKMPENFCRKREREVVEEMRWRKHGEHFGAELGGWVSANGGRAH